MGREIPSGGHHGGWKEKKGKMGFESKRKKGPGRLIVEKVGNTTPGRKKKGAPGGKGPQPNSCTQANGGVRVKGKQPLRNILRSQDKLRNVERDQKQEWGEHQSPSELRTHKKGDNHQEASLRKRDSRGKNKRGRGECQFKWLQKGGTGGKEECVLRKFG